MLADARLPNPVGDICHFAVASVAEVERYATNPDPGAVLLLAFATGSVIKEVLLSCETNLFALLFQVVITLMQWLWLI